MLVTVGSKGTTSCDVPLALLEIAPSSAAMPLSGFDGSYPSWVVCRGAAAGGAAGGGGAGVGAGDLGKHININPVNSHKVVLYEVALKGLRLSAYPHATSAFQCSRLY